jgi:uncharacterized small protein (DUF1192 family)
MNINHLQLWFANIVDIINENTRLIAEEINAISPGFSLTITTLDTAPVDDIKDALGALQSRIERLEQQLNNKGLLL